MGVDKVIGQLT